MQRPTSAPTATAPPPRSPSGVPRRAAVRAATEAPVAAAVAAATGISFAAGLATIAGLGGRWWPILDLATHFRLHGLLALTPGLALAIARRRPRLALALGVPWLVSAVSVARCWLPPSDRPSVSSSDSAPPRNDTASPHTAILRIATFNVWGINPTPQRIAPFLEASGADIAVLIELRPPLAAHLADPAVWAFEPVATAPRDDFYGVGIYVRRDAATRGIVVTDGRADVLLADDALERPSVTATVTWAGRQATVIGVHPPPPKGARMTIERDRAMHAAVRRLVDGGRPGIVCGDVNAAPWSSARRAAGRAAPMHDAARGHGYAGTWPAFVPAWLGIPIDVCLIDPRLRSDAYAVGPMLGSDHRPVVATLTWRE